MIEGLPGHSYDATVTAERIDGNAIAETIRAGLAKQCAKLALDGHMPRLAVVHAGDDSASASYVRAKERAAAAVGVRVTTKRASDGPEPVALEREIGEMIGALNSDPDVDGIILQLPLPEGVDEDALLERIDPFKDVDGLHPANQGRLLQGCPRFIPATPHGVQQLLVRCGHDPVGKHVTIVGRSRLVGAPLAAMLMQKRAGANATVTICHKGTPDLGAFTRRADILVVAVGRPEVVGGEMVREGAVVIDVGINRVDDPTRKRGYRLVGDVDFASVAERAAAITPVPGGVGPMTVAMLLANVVRAATQYRGAREPGR